MCELPDMLLYCPVSSYFIFQVPFLLLSIDLQVCILNYFIFMLQSVNPATSYHAV